MVLPASVIDSSFAEGGDQKVTLHGIPTARILLVEDMEDVRRMMERRLKAHGYEVLSAMSGDAAFELFQRDSNFGVLITDIVMPGQLQGAELALKIKSAKPDIGVIYMSGHTRGALEDMAIEHSDVFLNKPVAKSDLYAALDQILNAHAVGGQAIVSVG